MTIHVVDPAGGLNFSTIGAALAACEPGDTIEVMDGVYKEELKITKADITLRAFSGHYAAIIDGGYSHEWAKKSGTDWTNLVYRPPEGGNVITVAADGFTVDGITIQNSHDAGIAAGSVSYLSILNCRFRHTYNAAIRVNGAETKAREILVENCEANIASVQWFDPTRADKAGPSGVSGVMKFGDVDGVIIRKCILSRGWGEGCNQGKNTWRLTLEDCTIYDCNHKHSYGNSNVDGVVRNNIIFSTGDPAHLEADGEAPAGLALVDETARKPYSTGTKWIGNVVVNMGIPWQLKSRSGNAGWFECTNNTFIWGPLTRKDLILVDKNPGLCNRNIFHVVGNNVTTGTADGMTFKENLWSKIPPTRQQGVGDYYGDTGLVAPDVMPTSVHDPFGMGEGFTLDLNNYRPRPDSPAVTIIPGVVIGALPPVEPDPDPEPEPADYEDIVEALDDVDETLEAFEGQLRHLSKMIREYKNGGQ